MKDYMLTTHSRTVGPRDVQVNNAPDMATAIELAERETGCRVDHGRSGILPRFRPGIVIDAASGLVHHVHDELAAESMRVVQPKRGWMD